MRSPTPHPPPPPPPTTEARQPPDAARSGAVRVLALAIALAVTGALVLAMGLRPRPLPVLGTVPPFSLTAHTGATVGARELTGHVWVADFIFTRCPDFCPALTARMAALQERLANPADPVRLVSFTVDPEHDTPAVLAAYAARYHAGASWMFLTGPRDTIAGLLRDGFRVAYADGGPAQNPITHSDRFVLVDQQLRIRGYYHGTDPEDLARLARDTRTLSGERSS